MSRVGLEEFARNILSKKYGGLLYSGFMMKFREITSCCCVHPTVVPDAFSVGDDWVTVYEVEDTSKLTESKLRAYSLMWFCLDCDGVSFSARCTDRYGVSEVEVPLADAYMYFLMKDVAEIRDMVAST